ncbi:hypothetical protein [Verrucosispora sp. FIM060022]|uniref:hypothetical protein n=1 Tax=Verrucosispora sp. FIM060022 TaxID=1479020 RepID=UPI000F888BCF|nr:hypothetical protein [Verrucosispora sp. FIM060022]RUL90963.1 hypothetical protein EG812_22200 [Verrucosispora sp. FIM060022]
MTLGEDTKIRRRSRRWVLLLAAALMLCTAGPVGVAAAGVGWLVVKTHQADQGQPTPAAAANVFMLAVSSGEELGLRAVLAPERRDQLVEEWRSIRDDISRTYPNVSKVSTRALVVEDQADDRAQVVTEVYPVWWSVDAGGLMMHGSPHPWRFETRRDDGGWRVWSVDPHPWCGGHVRVSACQQQ